VSRAAYEIARKRGDQFLVAPAHVLPEIEEVVFRMRDYVMVQKRGEAGEQARENNPRATGGAQVSPEEGESSPGALT